MDPANTSGGGVINPSSPPSDFQGDTPTPGPSTDLPGPDFTQSIPESKNPSPTLPDPPGQPFSANTVSTQVPPVVPPAVPPQDPLLSGEPLATPPPEKSSIGSKKTVLLAIVGLLLLGAIGGGIYLASQYAPKFAEKTVSAPIITSTPAPIVAQAKVNYLEGKVWNVSGDTQVALTQGQSVSEGSTIETEEDAKVLLAFEGGSILRIGPASKVTLTSLNPEALVFLEEAGVVYAYVDDSGTGTFTIDAGDLTVDAVGTAFSVEKDELVLINVYENKVKVTEEGKEEEVSENKQYVQGMSKLAILDSADIESDNFLQWALEEELKRIESEIITEIAASGTPENKEAYKAALESLGIDKKELIKEAFLATTSGTLGSITLTGQKTPEGAVSLSWTADGLAGNGYRIVWSTSPGKSYPGDKRTNNPLFGYAKTLGPMKPGKTWYYRVCEWTGATCGVYSNELSFSF